MMLNSTTIKMTATIKSTVNGVTTVTDNVDISDIVKSIDVRNGKTLLERVHIVKTKRKPNNKKIKSI